MQEAFYTKDERFCHCKTFSSVFLDEDAFFIWSGTLCSRILFLVLVSCWRFVLKFPDFSVMLWNAPNHSGSYKVFFRFLFHLGKLFPLELMQEVQGLILFFIANFPRVNIHEKVTSSLQKVLMRNACGKKTRSFVLFLRLLNGHIINEGRKTCWG